MKEMVSKTKGETSLSKSELEPWPVILGHLFNLDSLKIPHIINKTGMVVDWHLTQRDNWSDKYRKAAYLPRINATYNSLSEQDRLRVAYIVASELAEMGYAEALNANLEKIGWRIEKKGLIPIRADVRELFFPKETQHDAYVEIREIFQRAKGSITVIDPYIDSTIFITLKTISAPSLEIRLLTYNMPNDFIHEAKKFKAQHVNFNLEVRKSKEFHDRFILIDNYECWHIGCSIKDAGNKAFMISKIEDEKNRNSLIIHFKESWNQSQVVL